MTMHNGGAPREVGMAHQLAALPPPLPSFQLSGAHTSACLIALKARSQGLGGTVLGTKSWLQYPKPRSLSARHTHF